MTVEHENLGDTFEVLHINIVHWQILSLTETTQMTKYSLKNSV